MRPKNFATTIDKVAAQTAFDPAAALPAAEAALSLLAVTHGLADAFQRRKTELAALDFDDLLIRARDLISGRGPRGLAEASGRADPAAAGR